MSNAPTTVFGDRNNLLPEGFKLVATGTEDTEGLARLFDQYVFIGDGPLNGKEGCLEKLASHLDANEIATIVMPGENRLTTTVFRAYSNTVRRCDLTFGSSKRNDHIIPVARTPDQPTPAPAP